MAYRVIISGVPIECDSIEEGIALAQKASVNSLLEKAERHQIPAGSSGTSGWTEARMTEFFSLLKGNQRRLIDELLDSPGGRTGVQLVSVLGTGGGKALAGVFTGLWKNAKKIGADPTDVYKKRSVIIANKRMKEYGLSDSFRAVADKVKRMAKE